jgi:O-antigen ligase
VQRIAERAVLGAALDESSTASHLDLWAVGIRVALDNPILGVGPEIYPSLFPEYRDRVLSPARAAIMARFRPESPHNVPIAVADAAGVPALVAYLALVAGILVAAARRLATASRRERWLLAGLIAAVVGHLVTDLFMTAEAAGSWTFWVLLGVLSVLASAPRSTNVPDSSPARSHEAQATGPQGSREPEPP